MTTCTTLMDILKPYVVENDYNAFEKKFNLICGTSPNHCRETWNAIQKVYIPLQICRDDVHKIAIDAFRPLISKQNETILPEVLQKVKSYVKGDHGPLTRKKVEKFIDKARGNYKIPPQNNKLVRCGFPDCMKGAYKPAIIEGVPLCPDCAKKIKANPALLKQLWEKTAPPERTVKKTYNPLKPSWAERKAMMHPKVSKMETVMELRLREKGISYQAQTEFCLQSTTPDFYFPSKNLAVYLDGEKVHSKREDKDETLRNLLQKRHGVKVVAIVYKDNTQKSEDEILQQIIEAIQ